MNFTKTNFCLFIICLTLLVWLAGYIVFSFSAFSAPATLNEKNSEAIIVLTGGNHRIRTGMELLAADKAPHLFISGVHRDVSRKKILTMWRGDTPLSDCCISLGRQATTTIGNAQEVRNWVNDNNYRSIHLVTSTYHMKRALLEFRHALPDIEIFPSPVAYKDYIPSDIKFWVINFSEYNKYLLRVIYLSLPQMRGTSP